MTFDDDFVLLPTNPPKRLTCKSLGIDWPPPFELILMGVRMHRKSMSKITDPERHRMTHVCRGAQYEVAQVQPLDQGKPQ